MLYSCREAAVFKIWRWTCVNRPAARIFAFEDAGLARKELEQRYAGLVNCFKLLGGKVIERSGCMMVR